MTDLMIDTDALIEFLIGLLNIPSPTGYPVEAIPYIKDKFRALDYPGAQFSHTPKGALRIELPGEAEDAPRAVTAHTDTLGAMVAEVKDNGRLRLTQLGGYMWNAIENESVTIRTRDNRRYRGSVLTIKASTHAYGQDAVKLERNGDTIEVRLDARTCSADETRALGVEIGDFVFLDPRVEVTETGFVRSRHLDDKASVATIYAALASIRQCGATLAQRTTILFAVDEEIGLGASVGLPSDLAELLVVDMAVLGPAQNSDEYTAGICVKDSGGPYHLRMIDKLIRLAHAFKIPYKLDVYPFYGSDGGAYARAGGAARVGLIGPGVNGSHAYERTHRDGLTHTAHLVARYLSDDAHE
ncbi:MAG: M42 family metallopeptidase [Aggregatilineales bacterium]